MITPTFNAAEGLTICRRIRDLDLSAHPATTYVMITLSDGLELTVPGWS
jgi:hypothetical protein